MKKVFCLLILAVLAGCAKIPGKIESPRVSMRVVIEQNRPNFIMTVLGGIRNENSAVAILDYEGELILKDNGVPLKKSSVSVLRFKIGRLFPFETAPVSIEVKGSEDDFKPVFDMLEINQDEVIKSGGTDEIYVQDDDIELVTLSYRKADIDSLLKGK